MWCGNCQQDVPAVASALNTSRICCARCGEAFPRRNTGKKTDPTTHPLSVVDFPTPNASASHLDWKLEDELREAQRLVQWVRSQRCSETDSVAGVQVAAAVTRAGTPIGNTGDGLLAWCLSTLGLSGLVCGSALLVGSLVSGRQDLWATGLATALIGQVVLVCGILLRRDDDRPTSTATSPASVPLQPSTGIQPSGLSIHFAHADSSAPALNTEELRKEIEAAMRRHRAA